MSLSKSISPLLRLCRILGLAAISRNKSTSLWEPNHFLKIWSTFSIVCNIYVFFVMTIKYYGAIESEYKMISLLETFAISLFSIHALFSLTEMVVKQKLQVELINHFEWLDIFLTHQLNIKIECKNNIGYGFVFLWSYEIATIIFANIFFYFNTGNVEYFTLLSVPYFVFKLSNGYSALLVRMVHEYLNVLNQFLDSATKQYDCDSDITLSNRINLNMRNLSRWRESECSLETLLLVKDAYSHIWDASLKINKLIYCALPIALLNSVAILIYDCWLVMLTAFIVDSPWSDLIAIFFIISCAIADLVNIILNSSKAAKSVSQVQTLKRIQKA